MIVKENESIIYKREGLVGNYYQLPTINDGMTISVATFTGEHGERTIGENSRIYYIMQGSARFIINTEEIIANEGDVVAIPAGGTYNLWPQEESVKVLLVMELLDIDKLPR